MTARSPGGPRARRAGLLSALALAGCFGGGGAAPRLYHPPVPEVDVLADPGTAAATAGAEVRLLPVRAAPHLELRIVWRTSPVEVGYYDQERWTEPPASYAERALAVALFERRGFVRTAAADAPWALEVEVLRFEEVLLPEHRAVVALSVALWDRSQRCALVRTVVRERPVAEESAAALARAIGAALAEATAEAAALVAGEVARAR